MYDTICDMLVDERVWKEKVSRNYIEKGIHQLLACIVRDGSQDRIIDHLNAFIQECENAAEEYYVYLPLDNIMMVDERIEFGKTILINMNAQQMEQLIHKVAIADLSQQDRDRIINNLRQHVFPLLQNRVVVMCTLFAESERARELAEIEGRRILDILRYFIFLAYRKRQYIDVGLRGDVRYGSGGVALLPATYQHFHTTQSLKSPRPFVINEETKKAMEYCGVFALTEMLNPDQKTAFSETLFVGIHWVANALGQSESANEYLSLVSSLETFLTREKTDLGSISNAIASGVGWVLGHDEQERLKLHKELKDLYNLRSTISHGGNQQAIADRLPLLRNIVSEFILTMVHRRDEFRESGKQGLFDWIDQGPMRTR